MLILSTFTSYYLQSPLEYLTKEFYEKEIVIKYTDINLLIWINRCLDEKINQPTVIFFRLIDLNNSNSDIEPNYLEENLKKIIEAIIKFKKNNKEALIVVLCPSPEHFYDEKFQALENFFLEKLQRYKIHTLSLPEINAQYSLTSFYNPIEKDTRIPYSFEFYIALANVLARKLHCIQQVPYKVIIVDCDNTLWTGIAGDIGPENVKFEKHNLALQRFLVNQKEKGVFICLCSKNEEETVNKVFSLQEDKMILKMSDVTLKKINRDTKSNNILEILYELKLANAKNAMFIDDSEREINDVKQNLSEIFCVQMPQTYREYTQIWSFDIDKFKSITQTDKDRLELFKKQRILINNADFKDTIEQLKITRQKENPLVISQIEKDQKAEIERIVQMSKKINQFNLFPFSQRSNEEIDIEYLLANDKITCFIATIGNDNISTQSLEETCAYSIRGDLTGLAICKLNTNHILIEGFFLSCRNAGLEVEYALIKHIAVYANEKKLDKIKIKFKKTEVNKLAETFVDVLCDEFGKKSAIRSFLKFLNEKPLIHTGFKNIFNSIGLLPKDLGKKLNEEVIFEFPSSLLAQLDPYFLTEKTMKLNLVSKTLSSKRFINEKDIANAKLYLASLEKETATLKPLVEKFSIGSKFKLMDSLTEKIIEKLKFLLPSSVSDFSQALSLVQLGLTSLQATYLSASLYEDEKVIVDISLLLNSETTILFLVDYINQQKNKKIEKNAIYESDEYHSNLSFSLQEERIFHAEQNEGAINKYLMTFCFFTDELNINYLELAYQKLIKFFDVFGYFYSIDKGGNLVKSVRSPEHRTINFSHEKIDDELELTPNIRRKNSKPWPMINSKELIGLTIFEVKSTKKFFILFQIHHCICDAFSVNVCLDVLSKFYNALLESTPLKLVEALPYQAFIYQTNKKINDEYFQLEAKKFWLQQLSIYEEVVEIPANKSISPHAKLATELKARKYEFEMTLHDSMLLNQFATSMGVTVYSTIMSLFSVLIANYTFNKRISILSAASGREPPFLNTPGFFVNLLIYVFNLEENQTLCDFVIQNHKNILNGIKFQSYPFLKMDEILQEKGIRNVLENIALVFQNNETPKLQLNDKIAELVVPKQSILLDMREHCRFGKFTLFVQSSQQKLNFVIEYAEAAYTNDFINRIAKNFLQIINQVCNTSFPELKMLKLKEISVVCDEERSELMELGRGPELDFSKLNKYDNLVGKFQKSVEKYPNNTALCYGKESRSYREIDNQSTQIAYVLNKKGVKQGDFIGILLGASHLFFIAELAALKVGAVFIPLSNEDPIDRLKLIINDAKINFFIIDEDTKDLFDSLLKHLVDVHIQIYQMSCKSDYTSSINNRLPSLPLTEEDKDACIVYTSGSTGVPKGVVIKQKAILRVVESPNYLEVSAKDKISQTANHAFDAAQLECWLAWNNGASLVIFDKKTFLDPTALKKGLMDEKITIMWFTVALFHQYAYLYPSIFINLKYLITGGDVVDRKAVESILNYPNTKLKHIIEAYGPTEAGIFTSTCFISDEIMRSYTKLPIGKPVNNTEVYLLSQFNQLTPMGGIGLLFIGGDGVGNYFNRPELQGSFLSKPYYASSKLYNSGDLVKWGIVKNQEQMIFERRVNDKNIKKQGYFVSLSEIENVLVEHAAIKQAVVLELPEKKVLKAFFIRNKKFPSLKKNHLIQFLSKKLPQFMLPAFYEERDFFPITRNGKLDKRALLNSNVNLNDENNLSDLSVHLLENESKLLQIFKNVLINSTIEIKDNFFYCGGTSIQAIQLIAEIEQSFGKRISFDVLREHPTPRALNKYLELNELAEYDLMNELKTLKTGNFEAPPIIFIHPAGGGLFCFNKLITSLEEIKLPNSCYGIEDPIIMDREVKSLTIEQMATLYLECIDRRIDVPYIIAGYSFGGMVALEMAAKLEKQKRNCLGVILFDTWVVSCADAKLKETLREDVLEYCREIIQRVNTHCELENIKELTDVMYRQCEHYQNIGFQFIPDNLTATPVNLFKAIDLEKFHEMEKKTKFNFLENFINKEVLKVKLITGSHFNFLDKEAGLIDLARYIADFIDEISKPISLKSTVNDKNLFVKKEVNDLMDYSVNALFCKQF